MKKLILFITVLAILISLSACGQKSEQAPPNVPVMYYYRCADVGFGDSGSVIQYEHRESYGHEGDFIYLLNQYLKGPVSDIFVPTFPSGTAVRELKISDTSVLLTLNDELAILTGMDLSIAGICLAKTVMEMTGCNSVTIRGNKALLDGQKSITLTPESFQLFDKALENKSK